MGKTLVTNKELCKWLTDELRKIEDCEECTIHHVYQLKQPDKDGCNWSPEPLIITSCDVPMEHIRHELREIVHRAKTQFNLRD